jgi:hypothetical protein
MKNQNLRKRIPEVSFGSEDADEASPRWTTQQPSIAPAYHSQDVNRVSASTLSP